MDGFHTDAIMNAQVDPLEGKVFEELENEGHHAEGIAEQQTRRMLRQQITDDLSLFFARLFARGHHRSLAEIKDLAFSPCFMLRSRILEIDLLQSDQVRMNVPYPLSEEPSTTLWSELVVRLFAASINDEYCTCRSAILGALPQLLARNIHQTAWCSRFEKPRVFVTGKPSKANPIPQANDGPGGMKDVILSVALKEVTCPDTGRVTPSPYIGHWKRTRPHKLVLVVFDFDQRRYLVPGLVYKDADSPKEIAQGDKAGSPTEQATEPDPFFFVKVQLARQVFWVDHMNDARTQYLRDRIKSESFYRVDQLKTFLEGLFNRMNPRSDSLRVVQLHDIIEKEAHILRLSLCDTQIQRIMRNPQQYIDPMPTLLSTEGHPLAPTDGIKAVFQVFVEYIGISLSQPQLTTVVGNLISLSDSDNGNFVSVHGPPGTAKTTTMCVLLLTIKSPVMLQAISKALRWPSDTVSKILSRRIDVVSVTNQAVNNACEALLDMYRTLRTSRACRDCHPEQIFQGCIVRYCHFTDLTEKPELLRHHQYKQSVSLAISLVREEITTTQELVMQWDQRTAEKELLKNSNSKIKSQLKHGGDSMPAEEVHALNLARDANLARLDDLLAFGERPPNANRNAILDMERSIKKLQAFADDPVHWLRDLTSQARSASTSNSDSVKDWGKREFNFLRQAMELTLGNIDTIIFHTAGQLNVYQDTLMRTTCRDVVMIDEAGQLDKLKHALVGASAKKMILFGDAKQMPPWSLANRKLQGELATSLLEDVLDSKHHYILAVSFRLHPIVVDYLNQAIYHHILVSPPFQELQRTAPFQLFEPFRPLTWIDIEGQCIRAADQSCLNVDEASTIMQLLDMLEEICRTSNDHIQTVRVITLYRAQREYLQDQVNKAHFSRLKIQVITGETAQGTSVDVTIVSMVISDAADSHNRSTIFTTTPRFNVALTRAKYSVILVGSRAKWIKDGVDEIKTLLSFSKLSLVKLENAQGIVNVVACSLAPQALRSAVESQYGLAAFETPKLMRLEHPAQLSDWGNAEAIPLKREELGTAVIRLKRQYEGLFSIAR